MKVTHLGQDYGTIEVDGVEFECSLGLAEAIFKEIKADKRARTWVCEDSACAHSCVRSYEDLATAGEPYCEKCDGDMRLKY